MTKYEKLEALYKTLPTIDCKRKCQYSCMAIIIPKIEAKRLEEKRGFLDYEPDREWLAEPRPWLPDPKVSKSAFIGLSPVDDGDCVFLAPFTGKCMAYSIRPSVCRLWGLVDHYLMRCRYGCVPTRWMSDAEQRAFYEAILVIQNEKETDGDTER